MARARFSHKPDQFQQEAIACRDRGIRIVAPAGSGKTETIARRVAARTKSGIDPERILILAFDTNARKSLEAYLKEFSLRSRLPVVKTLNQLGREILRSHFPHELHTIPAKQAEETKAIRGRFQPYEDELPVLEWDGVRRRLVNDVFQALKDQGFRPPNSKDISKQTQWLRREYFRIPDPDESASIDDFWGMPSSVAQTDAYEPQIALILKLFGEHDQFCRELGVMDYTDQKSRAFYALLENNDIRERIRASYDEVVVDECQDINRIDALLVWSITGEQTTLVLAGDDDQTLYEFRNAHSLYLREPERFFSDRAFTTMHLNISYRSPDAILAAANTLISNNIERIAKSPTSGVRDVGEIVLLPAVSTTDHNQQMIKMLHAQLAARDCAGHRDVAFLCHDEDTRRQVLATLRSARVPIFNDDRRSGSLVEDGVEVLTFHKAKGRQWPVVIIPNSNDRVLPDDRSVREGQLESVRRHYYVAMTRASRRLVISYVRADDRDIIHRTGTGEITGTNGASRFLFEAGLVGKPETLGEETTSAELVVESEPDTVASPEHGLAVHVVPDPVEEPGPKPAATGSSPVTGSVERVEVIVGPVVQPSTPKKPQRSTKPWELRQTERQSLARSLERWEKEDYAYALLDSWKVIEAVMKRVVRLPVGDRDDRMVRIIDRAIETGQIERDWGAKLHAWRKERNRAAAHPGEEDRPLVWEVVTHTPDFLTYLAERIGPKQVDLEVRDNYLFRLTRLVEMIGRGSPSPSTGKPLKAIRFDPGREAIEMIPFQFLMVLRDFRFYIPDSYRWTTAPLMGRFLVDTLGGMPAGIRPHRHHGSSHGNKLDEERVYGHLIRLLELEAGSADCQAFLRKVVSDALKVGNGNFHAGLKLHPKKPPEQ